MSTADAPLARICSRQTCRRPARATLTFVYADSTAVIGPLSVHAEPHAYDLCIPHAQRMTPPRGWEIVRLEGVPVTQDDDSPAAEPAGLMADSGPLAPLSTLPGIPSAAPAAPDAGAETSSEVASAQDRDGAAAAEDPSEDDAPGNSSGSAPRGWGRRRRSRLRAVPSEPQRSAAERAPQPQDSEQQAAEQPAEPPVEPDEQLDPQRTGLRAVPETDEPADDSAEEPEAGPEDRAPQNAAPEPWSDGGGGGFDSLTDEIFAGESTEYVPARRGAGSQPSGMRRPHLRRGRR